MRGDAAYEKLAADAIDASLAWRPLDATNAGLHDYDGRLPDYSKAAIAAGTARLAACQAKLQALDPASLSPHNAYDRQIILAGLHRDLFWRRRFAPTSTIRWRTFRTLRCSFSRTSRLRPHG